MTNLITFIGSGKGTWAHVQEVIKNEEWEKIFIITDEFGAKNFQAEKEVEFILVNPKRYLKDLSLDIKKNLEGKIMDTEVAINFISGNGKEHMALLSAILKLGLGMRFVALTPKGVKEI
ncbi:hypothetical protein GF336_07460 [Candidatus Woesearchaeota archaeon]|nr:hypothetical protein [Candidatus Woesearchaeota archaeon]